MIVMRKILIAALLSCGLSLPAFAASTVNPNIPIIGSALQSGPMRNNFAAAATDINNILAQFGNPTAPSSPSTFQSWMNTSACPTACIASIFDGTVWTQVGTLNQSTHVYSVALNSGNVAQTDPITVSFSLGTATVGLGWNSSLAVAGSPGTLGINLAHPNFFTAAQTINLNATALPAALTGTLFNLGQADGVDGRVQVNVFGSLAHFTGAVYGGTNAAPTAVTSGTQLTGINAYAYNGAALVGPIVSFRTYAEENIASGHQGSEACIATTVIAATTLTNGLCQHNDRGITLESPTGGSKGAGTVNVSSGYYVNGAPISPATGGPAGTLLQGTGITSAPVWTTATYPATASAAATWLAANGTNWVASTATLPVTATGTGTILRADGTNWVATTNTFPNTAAIGTVLNASGANVFGATTTPTLGASGTLGTLSFGNATSGTVTISPVAGALGTVTAFLPANAGIIAELNYAQSWTATQTLQTILAGTTNTYDVGTSATVAAFRTFYAGTSFVGPVGSFTTSMSSPIGAFSTSVAIGGCTIGTDALCGKARERK